MTKSGIFETATIDLPQRIKEIKETGDKLLQDSSFMDSISNAYNEYYIRATDGFDEILERNLKRQRARIMEPLNEDEIEIEPTEWRIKAPREQKAA